jgi:hypothetical protein
VKGPPVDAQNPIDSVAVETVDSQFFPVIVTLTARDGITQVNFTLSISRSRRLRALLGVAIKEARRLRRNGER